MKKRINGILLNILYFLMRILPIQKNKITFINLHSNCFTGNNKAIHDKIMLENVDVVLNTISLKQINYVGMNKLKILCINLEVAYKLSTSKFVILNDYYSLFSIIRLRKKTELIQVWHGGGAFKKIGRDSLINKADKSTIKRNLKSHSSYSKVIVSCEEVIPIFSNAFGIDSKKVIATGLPRADIFFKDSVMLSIKNSMKNKYTQLVDKKVILYAPTFRDDERHRSNYGLDIKKMVNNLNSDELLIIKSHPFERGNFKIHKNHQNKVLDLSSEDINDLLIISDILITDYSSVIFEYAILRKPMIFFAYDLDKYKNELRGFYYEYESFVPGPIVKSTDDLLEKLRSNSWDLEKINQFAKRFNAQFNGEMATERVVNEIILKSKSL